MTEHEKLELEVAALDAIIALLEEPLLMYRLRQDRLMMRLNRARRLEREELQDAKSKG